MVLEPEFLVSFCILMIYKHLLTCDKNFQLEDHDVKIDLFLVDFERVRFIQEPKFLVSFCIFPTCNNILTDDKKFEHENGSFFLVLLWSLRAVGTLENLTDLQILITEEIAKTFRLTKILRKMTCKDMPRAPGLQT